MCEICRQTPCHPRCPNAPEPEKVGKCFRCKGSFEVGEKFLRTTEGDICEGCLEDLTVDEWLELMGESLTTAEREEM